MRGFQLCLDKNITTGFDDKSSSDEKIFVTWCSWKLPRTLGTDAAKGTRRCIAFEETATLASRAMQLDSVAEVS